MTEEAFWICVILIGVLLLWRYIDRHSEGMSNGSPSIYNTVYDNGRFQGGLRSDGAAPTIPPTSVSGGCQMRHRGGFGWNADLEPTGSGRGTGHVAADNVHGIKDLIRRTGMSGSDDDLITQVNYGGH